MLIGMDLRRIRCDIFRVSQIEMAEIAGVRQPTISRWERGLREPTLGSLKRIRAEALRRQLRWNDDWFFTTGGMNASELPRLSSLREWPRAISSLRERKGR